MRSPGLSGSALFLCQNVICSCRESSPGGPLKAVGITAKHQSLNGASFQACGWLSLKSSVAAALALTCCGSLHPGMTVVTAGCFKHQASAHLAYPCLRAPLCGECPRLPAISARFLPAVCCCGRHYPEIWCPAYIFRLNNRLPEGLLPGLPDPAPCTKGTLPLPAGGPYGYTRPESLWRLRHSPLRLIYVVICADGNARWRILPACTCLSSAVHNSSLSKASSGPEWNWYRSTKSVRSAFSEASSWPMTSSADQWPVRSW